jgi:ectoine hydroxylase-related dioxygenase (phytanoyl-CoA dioxygenase family)
MRTKLTPAQIDQYQRDGFLHLPGLLSPEEVAELKAGVLQATAAMGKKKVAGGADLEEGDTYNDRVFLQRLNLHRIHATVKRYMLAPALGRMLCQLAAVQALRVWHDQALIKEPFANPTSFHLDAPAWSFHSTQAISIWIALEDTSLGNGCLWFLPRSHKVARFEEVGITPEMGGLFRLYPEMARTDPVPVPMTAGDCSCHNGLTGHGAGPNMTRGRRIAMTCAFMPEGSTFNGKQNVLPRAYFESLEIGDVLRNDDWNPLVYAVPAGPANAA